MVELFTILLTFFRYELLILVLDQTNHYIGVKGSYISSNYIENIYDLIPNYDVHVRVSKCISCFKIDQYSKIQ